MLAMRAFLIHPLLPVTTAVAVILLANGMAKAADAPAHECDRTTRNPNDGQGANMPGVAFEDIDTEAAIAACTDARESHPDAPRFTYQLGRAHHSLGDQETAYSLYRNAAENGHAIATLVLFGEYSTRFYESDGKDETSRLEAVHWLKLGANDQRHPVLRYELGFALLYGELLPKDIDTGIRLVREAATWEHPEAQYLFGMLHLYGEGVEQDNNKAFNWLEAASLNGSSPATDFLKSVYRNLALFGPDDGTVESASEATEDSGTQGFGNFSTYGRTTEDMINYFARAADRDHGWANFMLGVLYRLGNFVPKDLETAKAYLDRAVELGEDRARWDLEQAKTALEKP